jgi:hypothetical protein
MKRLWIYGVLCMYVCATIAHKQKLLVCNRGRQ